MSEEKKPEVIDAIPANSATTVLDIRDASANGLAMIEERVKNQKKMFKIALGLTAPNQWTIFGGTDGDGVRRESVYPTGGAADTILRRAFGLTWGEKKIEITETPDGPLAECSAWLMCNGQPVEHFTGYRAMSGYIKTTQDLKRAVIENMKSVAVRDLMGLRFRTPAEFKEMGLDISKLDRRAEFQTHDKDPGTVTVPFGRDQGKPITEVSDSTLEWLAEAVKKSVADPDKAKWKTKNETLLVALRNEYKRRRAPAKTEKQPKEETKGEHDYGPDAMSEEEAQGAMDFDPETGEVREPGSEG